MSIEQIKLEKDRHVTIGEGQNLLLIHGWGVNSAIWQPVVKQLSEHYCVHLVDLPGFANQAELEDYSLQSITEALLKKLPSCAIWCGWSLGGLIATYVAHAFPERVEKLVQVCASLKFVEEGAWLGVKNQVFELFKQGLVLQPEKTLNRFLSLQAMGSETVKSDVVTIKALLKNSPKPKPLALISGLTLLNDVDLRVQFGELTMPCLSVFGSKDTLIPVNNVLAVKRINPLAEQVIFKKSAHAPFISEPNLFVDTLIDFIGKVD